MRPFGNIRYSFVTNEIATVVGSDRDERSDGAVPCFVAKRKATFERSLSRGHIHRRKDCTHRTLSPGRYVGGTSNLSVGVEKGRTVALGPSVQAPNALERQIQLPWALSIYATRQTRAGESQR